MSWIGLATQKKVSVNEVHGGPCPYFRKEFIAEKKARKAILKVSSLGIFKVFLNGKEIDSDILAPGWATYSKRIPYYTYEISSLLERENKLDIIVADGWYSGRICWSLRDRYGTYPLKLWAELVIAYENGTTEVMETDETWKVSEGKILYGDILCGEYIDNRLEPAFDQIPTVYPDEYSSLLEEAPCEHVKKVERLSCKRLSDILWDAEQNFAGIVRAVVRGKSGTKIRFRYAELLDKDGTVYTENLRNARCTDYFILKGEGEEVFEPHFTYHGFRYIETVIEEGEGEILSLEGIAVHNDLKRVGTFSCSHPLINQIYSNTLWGMRSNFVSAPTDCPQRDERLGWTADAQVFAQTAMYLYDCKKFYEKYMTDMRDGQGKNGEIYNVAPVFDFPPILATSPAWGDAVTVIPYLHYQVYGDKKMILDNLGACKSWVQYCKKKSFFLFRPAQGFGDWLSIGSSTDKGFLATAYFAYSALLVSKMCTIVGEDGSYYENLFQTIKRRLRKLYFHKGKIANDTQTAYVLSYVFELATKEEIADRLVKKLQETDYLLTTGFIGTRYLLPVLCDIGRSDLAYRLLAEKRFPSWGYTIENGATTIWERWDGYRKELDNPFQSASMNSYNHYSFGACTGWLYEYALGFRLSEGKLSIQPCFDAGDTVTDMSGTWNGISVTWQKYMGEILFICEGEKAEELPFDFGLATVLARHPEKNKIAFRLKLD